MPKSPVFTVACGAPWEPSRAAALGVPDLQDVLWGNARNADGCTEDACRRDGPSTVDCDATRQLAGGRRDHGTPIRDYERVAPAAQFAAEPHQFNTPTSPHPGFRVFSCGFVVASLDGFAVATAPQNGLSPPRFGGVSGQFLRGAGVIG